MSNIHPITTVEAPRSDDRELIEDLAARTESVSAAASEAVEGLGGRAGSSDESAQLIDALVDTLVDRLYRVREECDRIGGILERVSGILDERPVLEGSPVQGSGAARSAPVAVPIGDFVAHNGARPVAYPGTSRTELERSPSEGTKLLATQMAVAGESIAEIERRLRSDFGVADASLVVRDLFGSESRA